MMIVYEITMNLQTQENLLRGKTYMVNIFYSHSQLFNLNIPRFFSL